MHLSFDILQRGRGVEVFFHDGVVKMNMAHKEKDNSSSYLSFGRRRGSGYLLENQNLVNRCSTP